MLFLTPRMARSCTSCCGGGEIAGSKALSACVVMTILASPAKAFLPALWPTSAIRRVQLAASAPASPASAVRHHPTNGVARQPNRAQRPSRRSLVSLFAATDGAKDAAMAAVQAAEEALNRAAEESGAAAGAGEVHVTVAAARAAARNAMESLRRDELEPGGEGGRDVLTQRQDLVTSPARSAVQAALAAIAEAQAATSTAAGATAESSAAAEDAIGMVQAALNRRDSAAAGLGVVSPDDPSPRDESGAAEGGGAPPGGGDGGDQEDLTKEPESARWSRDSPAASHSHMAHLLWRQVAGPGDTVLDCTAGNGHDSLELAKTIALKDGLGSLYIMDVQERALDATRERLQSGLGEMALKRSTLIHGNFRDMPPVLKPMSVQLVVYNLGWLPGGDKSITTKLEDTLESIEAAKLLVKHGGMISVMLYRGHAEGKRESEAVLEYAAGLAHSQWRVFLHERINRPASPELLTIYRL